MEKIEEKIIQTKRFWYVYLLAFVAIEILNYGLLSFFVPDYVCFWISVVVIFLFGYWLTLLFKHLFGIITSFINNKQLELKKDIESLQSYIAEVDEKNDELMRRLADTVNDKVEENTKHLVATMEREVSEGKSEVVRIIESSKDDMNNKINNKTERVIETVKESVNDLKKFDDSNKENINNSIASAENNLKLIIENKVVADNAQNEQIILAIKNNQENVNEKTEETAVQINKFADEISRRIEDSANGQKEILVGTNEKISQVAKQVDDAFKTVNTRIIENNDNTETALVKTEGKIVELILQGETKLKDIVQSERTHTDEKRDEIISLINKTSNDAMQRSNAQNIMIEGVAEQIKNVSEDIKISTENLEHNVEDKTAVLVKKLSEFTQLMERNINEELSKECDIIKNKLSVSEKALREQFAKIESQSEKYQGVLLERISKIIEDNSSFKLLLESNVKSAEETVNQIHSSIIKLLNELFDNSEDSFEKHDRKIDLIARQISELSQKNNNSLRNISEAAEDNKQHLLETITKVKNIESLQGAVTETITGDKEKLASKIKEYYSECIEKILLVQTQIEGVAKATAILNNIYALLQNQKRPEQPNKDDSRVEEYKDPESGAIVKNYYKKGKLSSSEMISDGRKTYDVLYDKNGKITRSRNYNQKGEIVTELEFFENGQVKKRTETVMKNGSKKTITSKFDDKGNKIK